jgi:hypothetical protein
MFVAHTSLERLTIATIRMSTLVASSVIEAKPSLESDLAASFGPATLV